MFFLFSGVPTHVSTRLFFRFFFFLKCRQMRERQNYFYLAFVFVWFCLLLCLSLSHEIILSNKFSTNFWFKKPLTFCVKGFFVCRYWGVALKTDVRADSQFNLSFIVCPSDRHLNFSVTEGVALKKDVRADSQVSLIDYLPERPFLKGCL